MDPSWAIILAFVVGVLLGAAGCYVVEQRDKRRLRDESAARQADSDSALQSTGAELHEREGELRAARLDLQSEHAARVVAETRLDDTRKHAEEQRTALLDAEQRLREAFAALSHDALKSNSALFAQQAEERVKPLLDSLRRFDQQVQQMEQARQRAYGGVSEQLQQLTANSQLLARETHSLATALRRPDVKGRWGELSLRRAVELAGLIDQVDFQEQESLGDDTRLRPDMLVRLPGGRTIVVDAKAPTTAYLDALEAADDDSRKRLLADHARVMRQHMLSLSEKKYWERLAETPDFVVMFVPGESFFSAALEHDAALIEDALRRKVILASPTTLIALLRGVAQCWQQREVVENAQRISETAQKLYDRVLKFAEHFAELGDGLRRATESYNKSIGSWERRLAPLAEEMRKLGLRSADARAGRLPFLEESPRATAPEAGPTPSAHARSDHSLSP